jgi:hypothetical protein
MNKKAKVFLKNWCAANDYRPVWSMPQASNIWMKFQKKFEPAKYSIMLKHNEDSSKDMQLIQYADTAAEARIQGAKKLGFIDSIEYKLALKTIPAKTLEVIDTDKKYINNLRQLLLFSELRMQVEKVRFIPVALKEQWKQEVDLKLQQAKGIV